MTVDVDALRIIHYPDPVLRRKAAPVESFDDHLRAVADRMIHLMHEAEGIGLAAPQVGLPWRLFVLHVPPAEDRSPSSEPVTATAKPLAFVNPRLSALQGEPERADEGCLSLPDITGEVIRPPLVTVHAHDPEGREFSLAAAGLLARCIQHEYDHLDGVLIFDRMTQLSRLKNRSAIRSLEKSAR